MLGGLLIVSDDILDISSKGGLDGCLILPVRLYDICHHTDDAGILLPLFHDFPDAAPIALIALCQVDQRFQAGFLHMIGALGFPQSGIFPGQFLPESAQLLFHGFFLRA